MKKMTAHFYGIFLLLIFVRPAVAGWIAYADYSSCPRKYLPNTSGQEGPFSSLSDCQSVIARADREQNLSCARYSCKEAGASTSSSSGTSAAPGHELDKHIGDAVAAGMSGQISGADAVGLVGLGIMGNALLGASAPDTPAQAAQRAENQRIWAEQAARAAEQEQIKEAAYQMDQDAKSFALLDLVATDFQPGETQQKPKFEMSQAFTKGFEHANQCVSQNSGAACAGSQSDTCISDYRAGYDAGAKDYKLLMDQAFQAGKLDGANGKPMSAAVSKDAEGPCSKDWVFQYNRGHWIGRHPKAKK